MVTPTQVSSYVKVQPFRPFRLQMASGRTFDIRHPEMVKVGKSFLLVFSFDSEDAEFAERWEAVSLLLIEFISHIEQPVNS